jgi:hypothetical protein
MNTRLIAPALCLTLLACTLFACTADTPAPKPRPTLSREELMDPETCKGCHPTHYKEWKASMHAYASEDPVFRAMNELGQRETDGGMGDFCVQCHAPMALREGETENGMNLDEVPEHLQGVTCYFCHNIESVEGDHNAQLTLANDTTMRGGMEDPVRPSAHGVARSRFLQSGSPDSSRMCGACHDIVNDKDVHLERTFEEYEASIFGAYDEPSFASCISCHMDSRMDLAAVDADSNVGLRSVHSHLFAGVDVALTSWPDREIYKKAVECELEDSAFFFEDGPPKLDMDTITLQLDTNAGHNMPSGSAQDRRLWVELTAFDASGAELCTTGAVPDDVAVAEFRDPIPCNFISPGVATFRDHIFDADGNETHMFWRAAPSDAHPEGFNNFTLLPRQQDTNILHTRELSFMLPTTDGGVLPDRLRVRLRIRPMDHDVLEELIEEELLDPAIADEIPTFSIIGGERELQLVDNFYEWLPPPPRDRDCRLETTCNFAPDAPICTEQ